VVKRSKPQMGMCRTCRSVRVLVGGLCRDCRDADSRPAQPPTPRMGQMATSIMMLMSSENRRDTHV
jgi:hypothetical protein